MAKPVKPDAPLYAGPSVARLRAVRTGHNEYDVVEEVWTTPPTVVRVLKSKASRAMAQCRLRDRHLLLDPIKEGGL